jgi:hypothetical protein
VRPLTGPDVSASDLVIGSALSGLPVRPRAYADDGFTGLVETYARSAGQLEPMAARLDLRRADNGDAVTSVVGDLRSIEQDEAGGVRRKATFVVPLTAVAPGNYSAHAVVSTNGEVVAERTRHVEVLAGTAPIAAEGAERAATISPIEIARGDLGRQYIGTIAGRAQNTPLAASARHALEGRWEEAALALRGLDSDRSAPADALRGFTAFVREEYAAAVAALQRSLDSEPGALTAFFLGWAQDGAGNSRGAISAWRSAAHLDPSLASAHLALAEGYLRISERALAIQALRAGLTKLPGSVELQSRLEQLERLR